MLYTMPPLQRQHIVYPNTLAPCGTLHIILGCYAPETARDPGSRTLTQIILLRMLVLVDILYMPYILQWLPM